MANVLSVAFAGFASLEHRSFPGAFLAFHAVFAAGSVAFPALYFNLMCSVAKVASFTPAAGTGSAAYLPATVANVALYFFLHCPRAFTFGAFYKYLAYGFAVNYAADQDSAEYYRKYQC